MKRKTLMILTLLVAIFGIVSIVSKTKAATTSVQVAVSAWTWYCVSAWSINVWSTWASYSAIELSSGFATNSFYCVDQKWTSNRSMTVQASSALQGSVTWTIPAANISMSTPSQTSMWWSCTMWSALSKVEISTVARTLLNKVLGTWLVCSIQTTPTIYVTIPASSPVGTYTGTITVTYPTI